METFWRVSSFALLAIAIALAGGYSAVASDSGIQLLVENGSREYVVGSPESPAYYELSVVVQGDVSGELEVGFADVVLGPNGDRTIFDAGTLPDSLQNALYLVNDDLSISANPFSKEITLRFAALEDIKPGIYSGEIRIAFNPDSTSGGGSSSSLGASKALLVSTYGFTQQDSDSGFEPARLLNSALVSLSVDSFADRLLPDLPGVFNSGPIASRIVYSNSGRYPNFTEVTWKFSDRDGLIASQKLSREKLNAGEEKSAEVSAVLLDPNTGRSIDVIDPFTPIELRIEITSELGGYQAAPEVHTETFIIVPWKTPALIGLLLSMLIWIALSTRKRLALSKADVSRSGLD